MSVSNSPLPGPARMAVNHRSKSATRRVTFGAESQPPLSTAPSGPLVISSIFSHRSELVQKPRALSTALPLSQNLVMDYRMVLGSSRGSSASSGGLGDHYTARSRSAGYSSRTSSAGFRPRNFGRQVPRTPLGSRSPSPVYTNQNLTRSVRQGTPYSTSALLQRRRPKTTSTTSAQFHSRRLGAEMYPTLRKIDVEREKALFRSGVCLIERLLSETSRSQSARWRAVGPSRTEDGHYGDADSFCRASLAESHMNNADVARVFHVVPQRVVSARGSGRQGINVTLQQVNQSLCDRHHLLQRSITTTITTDPGNSSNNINNKITTITSTTNSDDDDNIGNNNNNKYSNNTDSNENATITPTTTTTSNNDNSNNDSNNNVTKTDSVKATGPNSSQNKPIPFKEEKSKFANDETDREGSETVLRGDKNSQSSKRDPKGFWTSPDSQAHGVFTLPKRGARLSRSPGTTGFGSPARSERSVKSSTKSERSLVSTDAAGAGGSPSPGLLPQHRIRGVDAQEHSAEWLEESRMKQAESVAILSEQLHTMIPAQDDDLLAHEVSPEKSISPLLTSGEDSRSLSLLPSSSENQEDKEGGGGEGGDGEGGGGQEGGGPEVRTKCMKKMQCEVLGPYSCADCTKIRLHERQHQNQTSLYPDLLVDPRTLVAPDRLRRLTSTLPPHLTTQSHNLDCGCAISMHSDFLFPVVVTDHDIQSRLKAVSSTSPAKTEERVHSSLADSDVSSLLAPGEVVVPARGRRKEEGAQILVIGDEEENVGEVLMSPSDMKVTVRYHTPSPEQKGVFITT